MRKTKLTPELRHSAYLAFQNIRQRCTNRNNKDFPEYGGRGIECAVSQEEFAKIYYRTNGCELCGTILNDKNRKKADGRTIDRIDHDGDYSMENLRVICRSCGRRNGKIPVRRTAKAKTNGNGCLPTPFQKNDGKWYCHYQGTQHYLGNDPKEKIRKLVAGESITNGERTLLSSVVEMCLDHVTPIQSPDSLYNKRRTYRRLIQDLGNIPIRDLTIERLEKYRNALLKSRKKSTVHSTFIQLSALLQFCAERKILPDNPCRKMPKLKIQEDAQPDFLTEDEIETLLDLCSELPVSDFIRERDRLIFLLMIHCGLRRIEVSNLRWSDVDFKRRILVVRNGKGGKDRLIALNDTIYEALTSCTRLSEEFVVTGRAGNQLARSSMTRITAKYLDALDHRYKGKKRLTLHGLRATFATRLCEAGVSTRVVQGLLGHADPRTTMRYAAASEAACLDAVRKIG